MPHALLYTYYHVISRPGVDVVQAAVYSLHDSFYTSLVSRVHFSMTYCSRMYCSRAILMVGPIVTGRSTFSRRVGISTMMRWWGSLTRLGTSPETCQCSAISSCILLPFHT